MGLQTVGFFVFDNSKMNLEFISSNYCLLNYLQYMSVSYKNYFSALFCFLLQQHNANIKKKKEGMFVGLSFGRLEAAWFLLGLCHLKTDGMTLAKLVQTGMMARKKRQSEKWEGPR